MILIADAGGTSIKWRMINQAGEIKQATTEGFNAYVHPIEKLTSSVNDLLKLLEPSSLDKLFFYGAGLSSPLNIQLVSNLLEQLMRPKTIELGHDLLASARALLGDQPGIACILGTGSNSCLYDGREIVENLPSLGYISGDEGSGNALGKKLLKAYFRKRLPIDLHKAFEKRYQITVDDFLKKVYTDQEGPSYLANFTRFLFHHRKHPFLFKLIYEEFEDFIKNIVMQYDDWNHYTINFSGSIAFYYTDILRQVGNDLGLTIKTIVEDPIAGLSLYHQKRDL